MKTKISKELKKEMDNMLKAIEKFGPDDLKIKALEGRVNHLEFVMEMAYDDLNEISHLMSFMEKHLEEENMQLSKCVSVIHSTVSKVAIDLMEEL